jgi:hypothetical protein
MMRAIAKIQLGIDFENPVPNEVNTETISYRELLNGNLNTHIGLGTPPSAAAHALEPKVEIRDRCGRLVTPKREEKWYDYILDQCDDWIDNTIIFEALSHFEEKSEPRTLRLAYETILKDEGSKDRLLKTTRVTSRELNDFTRSLSHPDMEGQKLHIKNSASKNNFVPISLAKATKFLGQRLLKPWLIRKQEVLGLAKDMRSNI